MKKIAIFASGSGSNAENIIHFFKNSKKVEVNCILCNKPNAFVIERAKRLEIPYTLFDREDLFSSQKVLEILKKREIDYIILAGFLWLIPKNLIKEYPNKIINIHPALLPNYGGKGMFGMKVHQTVIKNKEKESGISIHFVNDKYDEGNIFFQAKCKIDDNDNAESLAAKIHDLEYKYFPKTIKDIIEK